MIKKLFRSKKSHITENHVPEQSVEEALVRTLADSINQLKEEKSKTKNHQLAKKLRVIIKVSESIQEKVNDKPETALMIRDFFNYVLPMSVKMSKDYVQMENQSIKGENLIGAMQKIEAGLAKLEVASEMHLNTVYSDKKLDIETDLTVMKNLLPTEGYERAITIEYEIEEDLMEHKERKIATTGEWTLEDEKLASEIALLNEERARKKEQANLERQFQEEEQERKRQSRGAEEENRRQREEERLKRRELELKKDEKREQKKLIRQDAQKKIDELFEEIAALPRTPEGRRQGRELRQKVRAIQAESKVEREKLE